MCLTYPSILAYGAKLVGHFSEGNISLLLWTLDEFEEREGLDRIFGKGFPELRKKMLTQIARTRTLRL
jgi:hypothetical protein